MPAPTIGSEVRRRLQALIRDIPDYPKPGIIFKDITPLLSTPGAFVTATDAMAEPFANSGITHVVAIESRGFILGGPVAQRLGKLPAQTRREAYELEYGADALEIHADACLPSARVLIVDDVLATGGTADATRRLVESLDASVVGFSFLMSLSFLHGMTRLAGHNVSSVLTY